MTISKELQDSISALRQEKYTTRRTTVKNIDDELYKIIPVLDHGFIRVIDYMGDDNAVVQAARVSYGKGTKRLTQDRGLINYLMRHRHTTPFEMCDIKLHIKLPIFIARQWIRHRTASVNEYSARYSILSNEFYVPNIENLAPQSQTNKQGRDEESLPAERSKEILDIIMHDSTKCYQNYVDMMNEDENGNIIDESKMGLSRELARMNLTLNHYTEWYWKTNLHNLLHFLSLRADSHAQYEIRVYADKMLDLVKKWVPFTYDAFMEYRKESASFSKTGLENLRKMLRGEQVTEENSGMSKREWLEFQAILNCKTEELT